MEERSGLLVLRKNKKVRVFPCTRSPQRGGTQPLKKKRQLRDVECSDATELGRDPEMRRMYRRPPRLPHSLKCEKRTSVAGEHNARNKECIFYTRHNILALGITTHRNVIPQLLRPLL